MIIINKLELPQCPYCGEKLLYPESFLIKNKTVYECKCCDYYSEVTIKPRAFKFLGIAEIVSLFVFLLAIVLGEKFCLIGIFLVLFIFTGFYVLSPFSIRLCKMKKSRIPRKRSTENSYESENNDSDREIYSN